MKGVVGATLQQVVTHQVTKKEEEEDEGGMEALTLPGRVYYIKPRKLHGGATIKEVCNMHQSDLKNLGPCPHLFVSAPPLNLFDEESILTTTSGYAR